MKEELALGVFLICLGVGLLFSPSHSLELSAFTMHGDKVTKEMPEVTLPDCKSAERKLVTR